MKMAGNLESNNDFYKSLRKLKNENYNVDMQIISNCLSEIKDENDLFVFIEQKIYRHIYENKLLSKEDKEQVKNIILCNPAKNNISINLKLYFEYVEITSNICNKLYTEIFNLIKENFSSLIYFSFCLDHYVISEEQDILFVRKFLFNIAAKALVNDFNNLEKSNIVIAPDNPNYKTLPIVKEVIRMSIEYGCLSEQYDDVSYLTRKVVDISHSLIPQITLELFNPQKEYNSAVCQSYDTYIYQRVIMEKDKPLLDEICSYYKCLICKAGKIRNKNDELIDYVKMLLDRKYFMLNPFDYMFFISNDYPSYMMSIITYIYSSVLTQA